jgi:hypothetical protein
VISVTETDGGPKFSTVARDWLLTPRSSVARAEINRCPDDMITFVQTKVNGGVETVPITFVPSQN